MSTLLKSEEIHTDWESKKALIKKTICKDATDEELELFIHACKRTGLDPFMKQIYAVKRNVKKPDGSWEKVMSLQTSIDGFRVIGERTGRYAPGPEPRYDYDDKGNLISATAYVKKLTLDGTWHVVSSTAHFNEYVQTTKDGKLAQFWEKMPHVMLAKCAESLTLRKAFPAELSGLYTTEEMSQATKVTSNQEANTIEEALALEATEKTEEELFEQFYEVMKEAPYRHELAVHLNYCFTKTKSSKKEFLQGAIENPERYLKSYKTWLTKNVEGVDFESENMVDLK